MRTSGHGNDTPLILVPIFVSVVIGVILLGGPSSALETLNAAAREVAQKAITLVSAWL